MSKRILVLEEDEKARSALREQCERLGLEPAEVSLAEGVDPESLGPVDLLVVSAADLPRLSSLRAQGVTAPALALTSGLAEEIGRSARAAHGPLGVVDYVLRPPEPERLGARVLRALDLRSDPLPEAESSLGLLLVDPEAHVEERLREMLGPKADLERVPSLSAALPHVRAKSPRALLVDAELVTAGTRPLLEHLRGLRPKMHCLGAPLRGARPRRAWRCFDALLPKPFAAVDVQRVLPPLLAAGGPELLDEDGNLARPQPGAAVHDLVAALESFLERCARACRAHAVVDLSAAKPSAEEAQELVRALARRARTLGLEVRVVSATPLEGNEAVRVVSSLSEAQASAPQNDTPQVGS